MLKVIAISGWKGSGKDTVADIVLDSLREKAGELPNGEKISLANAIYSLTSQITGIPADDLSNPAKKNEKNTLWSKRLGKDTSFRDLIDKMGAACRNVFGPNVWCWIVENDIMQSNEMFGADSKRVNWTFVVPDVRFKNEIALLNRLRQRGIQVEHWMVLRRDKLPDWVSSGLNPCNPKELRIIQENFAPSIYEIEWCAANPKFDRVIHNDGTLEELTKVVKSSI